MDPRTNPYSPGAGTPPPELAGRDELIEQAAITLDRIRNGLASKSLLLVGLRGVGKTVLLNRIRRDAEARGLVTIALEAPEQRSLPGMLAVPLRAALLKIDRLAAAGTLAKRALRVLGGFTRAMKLKYDDVVGATDQAIAELDSSFFRVRFDRLTPSEKRYLRAMATLGTGPHRSGDIAQVLEREVRTVAPTRASLIGKGMVYSPAHGDTNFTVPLFDEFMKRVMPEER